MKINPKEFVSALQTITDLGQRNKLFKSLTAEQKRREIAYDCLQLTMLAKVHCSKGPYYWSYELYGIESKNAKEFQEKLVNDLPECKVCVRGGMMLSQIRLGNTISPKNNNRRNGDKKILRGFTMDSFENMEREYETSRYFHPYSEQSNGKIQNICLNVIANGDFYVEDKTDYLEDYLTK